MPNNRGPFWALPGKCHNPFFIEPFNMYSEVLHEGRLKNYEVSLNHL